jgi:hypothetical protein
MSQATLPSPLPSESWLLAWGSSQTANGHIVKLRAYAFDGYHFRTIWNPEVMMNAIPRVTSSGFTIDYEQRVPPYNFHDDYLLTVNGPVKVR